MKRLVERLTAWFFDPTGMPFGISYGHMIIIGGGAIIILILLNFL